MITAVGDADYRALSVRLEQQTGYDSIPTIEGMYEDPDHPGRFVCCFPGCTTATRSAQRMWLHVHFGQKHGLSFGAKRPQDAAEVSS
jgi:hypothetical protein